jgi:hypothetical protein
MPGRAGRPQARTELKTMALRQATEPAAVSAG